MVAAVDACLSGLESDLAGVKSLVSWEWISRTFWGCLSTMWPCHAEMVLSQSSQPMFLAIRSYQPTYPKERLPTIALNNARGCVTTMFWGK